MPATVERITPGRGRMGDMVSIVGSGFSPTNNQVTFDGSLATLSAQSTTQIDLVVPGGLLGLDRHATVVVTNLDDASSATWYWFAKDIPSAVEAAGLAVKIPWRDEIARGLGRDIKEMSTAEARYFERIASKALLINDLLSSKGDFFSKSGPGLGLRQAPAGTAGQVFVSAIHALGGGFQDRQCQTLSYGRPIAGTDLIKLLNPLEQDDQGNDVNTKHIVLNDGQIAIATFRERSSATSRITQLEVLVNGAVVLDLEAGTADFPGPGLNNGDHLTVYPGLRVLQADTVEVRATRNNDTTVCSVMAHLVVA